MAKVNIVITDTEEDGGVNFRVEFDPPIREDQDYITHAQDEAGFILEIMQHRADGLTLKEIAEVMDEDEHGAVVKGTKNVETLFEGDGEEN
jgi:hypothetical protein